jgi:ABC-type nitrate/sulfonate/bicarbonate transport system substrate-binding protein
VALATEGLNLDDVELVDVPIQHTFIEGDAGSTITGSLFSSARRRVALSGDLFALVQHKVDAIFSESSFSTHLRKFLGAVIVYDVHTHPDARVRHNNAIPQAFTVSAGLVRDRPDLVARVIARTLAAGEWAKTHREEVVHVTALEAGVSEEVADYTYPLLEHQLGTNLSAENVEAIRLRKQFLLSHGFIDRDFDLNDWIDPSPLAEAVGILRKRGHNAST